MFRQTPFTQSDLARSFVARETATKVRYFDPKTARMSGWLPKPPMLVAVRAMEAMAVKVRPVVAEGEFAVMALAAAGVASISHVRGLNGLREAYAAMPVAQLRTVASKAGVTGASRMRKADVIDALMAQPLSLAHA